VTTGVWARGILASQYGVDLNSITWVLSGDEHVAEYRPPSNVVPIEKGKDMAKMLESGELVAAIGVDLMHPDVQPLIANAAEAGFEALRTRGHYPINHLVVVKNELLATHPDLALDVFNAFSASKNLYVQDLRAGKIELPTEVDKMHQRVMEITGGDPLPYGVEPNRKNLEELVGHAVAQKIIAKPVSVDALFAPSVQAVVA